MSHRSQFIDSAGSMTSLLSNIVNNLTERILKLNVNTDTMIKNVKFTELKIQRL